MDDLDSLKKLLNEMMRISKKVVIVEILDPKHESPWGRLRHIYFMKFLGDAGEHFLSREEFDAVTNDKRRTSKFEMKTIRGVYQFAILKNKEND